MLIAKFFTTYENCQDLLFDTYSTRNRNSISKLRNLLILQCRQEESNLSPFDYESTALPTELQRLH